MSGWWCGWVPSGLIVGLAAAVVGVVLMFAVMGVGYGLAALFQKMQR